MGYKEKKETNMQISQNNLIQNKYVFNLRTEKRVREIESDGRR